ncbi:uncharacterized protein RCC_01358 [Ramularia collo-cygni]|uniref:Uncharacterized protein n=1 Tax=Ramularia collo-cygni TaxID=112498 RepID=A0A2D3ULU0_9PEZI|nr:uncharacterized protein RCC_01358 [Ramularia collo-cygni]CZT15502.1 uncharacterized protein RCC_01358 [Ramularia collo-cygni]
MLAITPSKQLSKQITPNILPCKITHSGPIPASSRHWNPQSSTTTTSSTSSPNNSATQTAYFRGRKLQGRKIPLPEGYEGKVLFKTDILLPRAPQERENGEDEEDEEVPVEVKQAEQMARFEEIVVWGHEALPGDEDVYVQGLEEWVGFAERIHAYDTPTETTA